MWSCAGLVQHPYNVQKKLFYSILPNNLFSETIGLSLSYSSHLLQRLLSQLLFQLIKDQCLTLSQFGVLSSIHSTHLFLWLQISNYVLWSPKICIPAPRGSLWWIWRPQIYIWMSTLPTWNLSLIHSSKHSLIIQLYHLILYHHHLPFTLPRKLPKLSFQTCCLEFCCIVHNHS